MQASTECLNHLCSHVLVICCLITGFKYGLKIDPLSRYKALSVCYVESKSWTHERGSIPVHVDLPHAPTVVSGYHAERTFCLHRNMNWHPDQNSLPGTKILKCPLELKAWRVCGHVCVREWGWMCLSRARLQLGIHRGHQSTLTGPWPQGSSWGGGPSAGPQMPNRPRTAIA